MTRNDGGDMEFSLDSATHTHTHILFLQPIVDIYKQVCDFWLTYDLPHMILGLNEACEKSSKFFDSAGKR